MGLFRRNARIDRSMLRTRVLPHEVRSAATFVVTDEIYDIVVVSAADPWAPLSSESLVHLGPSAFEVAVETVGSTFQQEPSRLDVRDHEISGNRKIRVAAIDDSLYVTTALLTLPKLLGRDAPAGAFVVAPTFDHIAVYAPQYREDGDVSPELTRVGHKVAATSTAPVCDPTARWWDGHRFHAIVRSGTADDSPLAGPPALLAALAKLPSLAGGGISAE